MLENSCLNRWFSLIYSKVAVLSYLEPLSSAGTGFTLVLDGMSKCLKNNTHERQEAENLAKENIHTDIFHKFEPPVKPMKWL